MDEIIRAQEDSPEVVEVLNREKKIRRIRRFAAMIAGIETGGLIFITSKPVTEKLEFPFSVDTSALEKKMQEIRAAANLCVNDFKEFNYSVDYGKPQSVNPADRQYKRNRR